ncbi:hypothetical protein P8452_39461 [Trifolium repens]|nr:hypothetical protein P8452_39461 [Trifolium repens]
MANPPPNDNDEYWRLLGKALFDGTWSDNSYAEIFDKPGGGDNSDSENDKLMYSIFIHSPQIAAITLSSSISDPNFHFTLTPILCDSIAFQTNFN